MALNPMITLMGDKPDLMGGVFRANEQAFTQGQRNRENAFQRFQQEQGAALTRGDQGALDQFAQFDPTGAFNMRGAVDERARAEQARRAAAAAAARNAQAAQQSDQIKQVLAIMDTAYDAGPEAFAQVAAQNGLTETLAQYNVGYGNYHAGSAGLRERVGYAAQSFPEAQERIVIEGADGFKYYQDTGERVLPNVQQQPKPGFRQATSEEAAARGAVGGQFGPDNRFYPTPTPSGMSITSTPDGGFSFTQGAGVGVGGEGVTSGKTKPGWERVANADGTGYIERPVRNGPVWVEMVDQSQKAERSLESFNVGNKLLLEEIDRAIELIEGGGIPTTGLIGAIGSSVPGTPMYALSGLLTTIKGNVGFDKLQDMRANSPTGGALGNVSDNENKTLQSVKGSLEQANRASDLAYNLRRLREISVGAGDRLQSAYNEDFEQVGITFGGAQQAITADTVRAMTFDQYNAVTQNDLSAMDAATLSEFVLRGQELQGGN